MTLWSHINQSALWSTLSTQPPPAIPKPTSASAPSIASSSIDLILHPYSLNSINEIIKYSNESIFSNIMPASPCSIAPLPTCAPSAQNCPTASRQTRWARLCRFLADSPRSRSYVRLEAVWSVLLPSFAERLFAVGTAREWSWRGWHSYCARKCFQARDPYFA